MNEIEEETNHDPHDGRAGSLVMQAIGDAVGFLVEGYGPEVCTQLADQVFSEHETPQDWIEDKRGPFRFGQYSDDTQLARELALSIPTDDIPKEFGRRVARLFDEDLIVGRGSATTQAADKLIAGVDWTQSGTPAPYAGNGAAMRAGPVGFLAVDEAAMIRTADDTARVTHKDVRSRAAAILVALVVADGIRSGPAQIGEHQQWCTQLAAALHDHDSLLADGVLMMPDWCDSRLFTPAEVCREIMTGVSTEWQGISPFATTSVLYALYAYLRAPDNPEEVLRVAISVGGDVDTVAAMAGAMVGAAVGLDGLTPHLVKLAGYLNDQGAYKVDDLIEIARAVK